MGICLTLHFLFKHFLKLYRPAMDPLGSPCTPWVWYLPVVTLIPSSDRPSPRLFICLFIQDSSLPEGLISFKFPECLLVSLVSVSELLEFQDCLSHLSIPYLAQFQNHHMFTAWVNESRQERMHAPEESQRHLPAPVISLYFQLSLVT